MRFVIQVKVKTPITFSGRQMLEQRGLSVDKNQVITGLAEDFDSIVDNTTHYVASWAVGDFWPLYKELNTAIRNGDYDYF